MLEKVFSDNQVPIEWFLRTWNEHGELRKTPALSREMKNHVLFFVQSVGKVETAKEKFVKAMNYIATNEAYTGDRPKYGLLTFLRNIHKHVRTAEVLEDEERYNESDYQRMLKEVHTPPQKHEQVTLDGYPATFMGVKYEPNGIIKYVLKFRGKRKEVGRHRVKRIR